MIKKIIILITIISTPVYTKEAISYYSEKPKWSFKQKSEMVDRNRFVNWTELLFSWKGTTSFNISKDDNIISKPFLLKSENEKEFRQRIYRDLLMLPIDYELTIERLAILNEKFRDSLLSKLYETNFFDIFNQTESESGSSVNFLFTGKNGLISMILGSHYFQKENSLEIVPSKYESNRYDALLIEARHVKLKPSVFPKIYSYDKNGQLILVYSVGHSDWESIIEKGFAKFYISEKDIKAKKVFYISALTAIGDLKSDVIISRDDYLKYFSSKVSVVNLSKGNLGLVINDNQRIYVSEK